MKFYSNAQMMKKHDIKGDEDVPMIKTNLSEGSGLEHPSEVLVHGLRDEGREGRHDPHHAEEDRVEGLQGPQTILLPSVSL